MVGRRWRGLKSESSGYAGVRFESLGRIEGPYGGKATGGDDRDGADSLALADAPAGGRGIGMRFRQRG